MIHADACIRWRIKVIQGRTKDGTEIAKRNPPRLLQMLPGHERTKIDEPMDTIFVKQVRANSPAAEAGLRTGDRVVSVDGTPTRGEQYASVVQRIHQAGPWLRLLVVSKEDDILQRVRRILVRYCIRKWIHLHLFGRI